MNNIAPPNLYDRFVADLSSRVGHFESGLGVVD